MKGDEIMKKIDKEKMIKKEFAELKKIFKDIDADKKPFADRLIQQCSFMLATLTELQETLNNDGSVELFINGSQKMLREHPAAKTYNTMIKNYNSTIKQLIDLLPEDKGDTDELLDFLGSGKK